MKKTQFTLIVSALLILASACNKNDFTIMGTLENGADKTIYLEELTPEGPLFIDSIKLDKRGNFKYKYEMPYPSLYNLHVASNDYAVLRPSNGETINVLGDYEQLAMSYTVTGSPESILLWQLQDYTNKGINQLYELIQQENAVKAQLETGEISESEYKSIHKTHDSMYLEYYHQQQDYIAHFIEENLGSLTTLIALYKPFNNHPLIDPSVNFDYYESVLIGLQEQMPDNPHTIHFKNSVEQLRFKYGQ